MVMLFPTCPACESVLDDSTHVGEAELPTPGGWGLCVYCSKILRYTNDLGVRAATGDEILHLRQDLKGDLLRAKHVIVAHLAAAGKEHFPVWARKWVEPGEVRDPSDIRDWLRSRPAPVKALIQRFPPECLVRATRPLHCPAPGHVGVLVSWMDPEDKEGCREGLVSVVDCPTDPGTRGAAQPSWLKVVGYHAGMTPEWIAGMLA